MTSMAKLCVAIYADGIAYKHWSLFVDGPTDNDKFIFHIMGSSTRYRFEMRKSDANKSASLVELIKLCDVDFSKIGIIQQAAENAVIHNEYPGYNCQDYVLELLGDLENQGCVDGKDPSYKKQKQLAKSKQEGFS
ncbi:hypothetical protein FQN49_007960 [Arthroderma sp. PD_2]|nr:hypothetical protein FQN49_007960 [Arthroderma sp. PD_2]